MASMQKVFSDAELTALAADDYVGNEVRLDSRNNTVFYTINSNKKLNLKFQAKLPGRTEWLTLRYVNESDGGWVEDDEGNFVCTIQFFQLGAVDFRLVIPGIASVTALSLLSIFGQIRS